MYSLSLPLLEISDFLKVEILFILFTGIYWERGEAGGRGRGKYLALNEYSLVELMN